MYVRHPITYCAAVYTIWAVIIRFCQELFCKTGWWNKSVGPAHASGLDWNKASVAVKAQQLWHLKASVCAAWLWNNLGQNETLLTIRTIIRMSFILRDNSRKQLFCITSTQKTNYYCLYKELEYGRLEYGQGELWTKQISQICSGIDGLYDSIIMVIWLRPPRGTRRSTMIHSANEPHHLGCQSLFSWAWANICSPQQVKKKRWVTWVPLPRNTEHRDA